jgi:hypothetical protein
MAAQLEEKQWLGNWSFFFDSFPILKSGFYGVRLTQRLNKDRIISNDISKRKKGGKPC